MAAAVRNWSAGRDAEYGIALALALSGGPAAAHALGDDLAARFPDDTLVRFSYLPALRAALAMQQGDAGAAVELLEAARPYELGFEGANSVGFAGSFYPVYLRGVALLKARRGPEAAAEFRKVVDHRGIVFADSIGALAHLQLGRAPRLTGDRAGAAAAYGCFLDLWKDGDADIPVFQEAQRESAQR